MRILLRPIAACVVLLLAAWWVTPGASAASEEEQGGLTAEEALAQEIAAHPDAVVIGNTVHHEDGTVFVAVDAGVRSLGQCTSGRFCVWSSTNYLGSFRSWTGSGVLISVGGTVGSAYNNRSQVAWLYNNSGTASSCYAAGESRSSVPSSYNSPAGVQLGYGSSC